MFHTRMLTNKPAILLLFLLLLLVVSGCESADEKRVDVTVGYEERYTNPFELPEEWEDYGAGDPYILRHNGMYYLYVSTKDLRAGIKAWSSLDLINWTYEGLVTEDEKTTSAYAPEVVYWNGTFYMYTSPAGNGHYVLTSENPTGPFVVRTENLGMSIDGSVFIDDDGAWYFTHAGDQGIVGRKMIDPFTFDYGYNTNAFMGHWTEGSMIIKKNGHYYMTYTGNHVFSKGYRINYAVSDLGPIEGYQFPNHNPLIINTSDDFFGLGHNSIVLGPDLDSYYAIYHNLIGHSKEGPPVRKMNIDRFLFNGKKMDVLGPTNYEMAAPRRADYEIREIDVNSDTADENTWLSEAESGSTYTAEYNFMIEKFGENGQFGTVFSYEDEQNLGYATVDFTNKKLILKQVKAGTELVLGEGLIPDDFDFTKLHTIRIEKGSEKTTVFLDGMKKVEADTDQLNEGKIGYYIDHVQPSLEYTAFSNHVNSSSDFEVYKPLPGSIEAIHFLEGVDRGYYIKSREELNTYRKDVPITLTENGTYSVGLKDKGDWLKYKVNVKEDGLYGVSAVIYPNTTSENATLQIGTENGEEQTFKLPAFSQGDESKPIKLHLGSIKLEKGFHALKVLLKKGYVDLERLELYQVSTEKVEIEHGLKEVRIDDLHGNWLRVDNGFQSNTNEDMKLYVGNERWTDLEAEIEFEIHDSLFDKAGLVMRVTNESSFEHQVKDSLMGYYISFSQREIALQKLNYDSTLLETVAFSFDPGKEYQLRVTAQENEINVYVDGEEKPILSYTDPNAFMYGKIGIRSEYSDVTFKNITIKSTGK